MNDKQLGVLYGIMLTIWLVVVLSMSYLLADQGSPPNANDYADKLCQELHGPQTGAAWIDGQLLCQTARGELLPIKEPK